MSVKKYIGLNGFLTTFKMNFHESLYCLAITKIYNPDRTRRDYWWNSGGTTYYTQ